MILENTRGQTEVNFFQITEDEFRHKENTSFLKQIPKHQFKLDWDIPGGYQKIL